MVDDARIASLTAAAQAEMALEVHQPGEPIAYTRTTYLDTDELDLLRAPGPIRRRLRIREYASAPDLGSPGTLTGVAYLELKASADGHRAKARVAIAQPTIERLLAGETPHAAFEVLARRTAADWLTGATFRPRMTTWYRRTSMIAPCGLRVTLDHGVAFCAPTFATVPGGLAAPSDVVGTWPPTVLEIKASGPLPTWLARELHGLEPSTGLSKFEAGMRAVCKLATQAA
jgi:hypothetical protein